MHFFRDGCVADFCSGKIGIPYILYISSVLVLLWSQVGLTQDTFQILRDQGLGYAKVTRGRSLLFPLDHAAHPEFRVEWWYLTANMIDDKGRDWGMQWTLFRQALSPVADTEGWDANQLWMAHAAITTPEKHLFEQRFARGGIGQAGVSETETDGIFNAWLDDWQWRSSGASMFPSQLVFTLDTTRVEMTLESSSDWVLHGDRGYSQKSAQGQASYYYSQPNIKVNAVVIYEGETIELSGSAWLDREWSSQPLAQNQSGWDWFSLHLDDGNSLMLYRLRHDDGNHWLSGSWIDTLGQSRHLTRADIGLVERSIRTIRIDEQRSVELPLEWDIELPALKRKLRIKPLYDQQWMGTSFSYWEGVVLVEDADGQSVGKGYMELTGYD
jgi:predicted secreted hydrolase